MMSDRACRGLGQLPKEPFAGSPGGVRAPAPRWAAISLVLLLPAFPVFLNGQGRIEGRVVNGTTKAPISNQIVRLLSPRGGMQEVAKVNTDAAGRFALDPIDSSLFYLLETEFQGIRYPAPVRFDPTGSAKIDLTVYEATRSDTAVRIRSLRILMRAEGRKARIQEEYSVLNSTEPPRTFSIPGGPGGSFRFSVPGTVKAPLVSVTGMMNVALPQTPDAGKSPGDYSIRYGLKPGVTSITVAYDADYSAQVLDLSHRVHYEVDEAEIFASPASLAVRSPLLKPAGTDTTNDIQRFEARNVPRGSALEAHLAGEAAPRTQAEQPKSGPSGVPEASGESSGPQVKIVPNSMTRLAVPFLLCLLLVPIWALGVRVAKEWPRWSRKESQNPARKQIEAKVDELFNSLADLDELFAAGKILESKYWQERLELKARLSGALKKAPRSLLEPYGTRNAETRSRP